MKTEDREIIKEYKVKQHKLSLFTTFIFMILISVVIVIPIFQITKIIEKQYVVAIFVFYVILCGVLIIIHYLLNVCPYCGSHLFLVMISNNKLHYCPVCGKQIQLFVGKHNKFGDDEESKIIDVDGK
jgi:hypothetical protein